MGDRVQSAPVRCTRIVSPPRVRLVLCISLPCRVLCRAVSLAVALGVRHMSTRKGGKAGGRTEGWTPSHPSSRGATRTHAHTHTRTNAHAHAHTHTHAHAHLSSYVLALHLLLQTRVALCVDCYEQDDESDEDREPGARFEGEDVAGGWRATAGDSSEGGDAGPSPPGDGGWHHSKREATSEDADAAAADAEAAATDAAPVNGEHTDVPSRASPPTKTTSGAAGAKREGAPVAAIVLRHPKKKHKMAAGSVKVKSEGNGGDETYLFLINGQYRTAEQVTKDAARAVKDAEAAAEAAEEAAELAEVCEAEAWEAERLANELLDEAERQKSATDKRAAAAVVGTRVGGHAENSAIGPAALFA